MKFWLKFSTAYSYNTQKMKKHSKSQDDKVLAQRTIETLFTRAV